MILFACPMCRQKLQAQDQDAGSKLACPKCGQRLQVPSRPAPPRVNKTVLGDSIEPAAPVSTPPVAEYYDPPQPAAPAPRPRPDQPQSPVRRGLIGRYIDWCGTRSVIFQSLLLGWTAFVGLGALGLFLQFAAVTNKADTEEGREAAGVAAFYCGLVCPLGAYLLLAIPLGIAAIATLESGRGPRRVHD